MVSGLGGAGGLRGRERERGAGEEEGRVFDGMRCARGALLAAGVLLGRVEAQVDVNAFSPAVEGGCISGHNQGGSCKSVLAVLLANQIPLGQLR